MHGRNEPDKASRRSARRQRRWNSKPLRGAIVAFGVVLSIIVPTGAANASACTDAERRNHMTCNTNPHISKCVLNVAGAGAVGAVFGGPFGFLGGVAGGLIGCATDTIG